MRHSRAKPPFPARMHNSIEKARPHVAKVTCFIEPFEVSSDPPDLLQQYRRWCSDPLQIPGGSAIGFPYMYITTVIATPAATPQSAPPLSRIVARPPPDPERERDLFSRGARIACVSANFSARWHSSRGNMTNFPDRPAQIGPDCVRERQLLRPVARRGHETPL